MPSIFVNWNPRLNSWVEWPTFAWTVEQARRGRTTGSWYCTGRARSAAERTSPWSLRRRSRTSPTAASHAATSGGLTRPSPSSADPATFLPCCSATSRTLRSGSAKCATSQTCASFAMMTGNLSSTPPRVRSSSTTRSWEGRSAIWSTATGYRGTATPGTSPRLRTDPPDASGTSSPSCTIHAGAASVDRRGCTKERLRGTRGAGGEPLACAWPVEIPMGLDAESS